MTGRDAIMSWEPKTTMEYDFVDYDSVDPKMLEMQAELYKQVVLETLIGRDDDGMAEYWDWVGKALDSRKLGTFTIKSEPPTELPQPVCNYRKPKVYWFGEAGNNINLIVGSKASHWAVFGDTIEGYFAEYSEESLEMANSFEPDTWEPQSEIFIGGSKPLKINDKDKDTLD